ncbi:MAG: oleate hydratase [Burkholderiaceae bacterium]
MAKRNQVADPKNIHVHLVGAGIATMSAAVFLIRDAGVLGEHIHFYEQLPVDGGSLDGARSPSVEGYVTRGGRMLEDEAYVCLWNLLESIPAVGNPELNVRQEIAQFNQEVPTYARARIIDRNHQIVDAADLGFDLQDRVELTRLIALPEKLIGARRIEDFFSEHFFQTNFWTMWCSMFAFQPWHSAIEMKRYLLRFMQEVPRIHTLAGVRRTKLNQYDSIVLPIQRWLQNHGVQFESGVTVKDVDFVESADARVANALHIERNGQAQQIPLGAQDYVFLTLGSMTADVTYGGDDTVPPLIRDKRDGGFELWETLALKADDFGRPNAFCGNVDESKWESFTLTMHGKALLQRIIDFSGNEPGTGALMTFKDSNWLMSIVVPHAPHFIGQPNDVYTLWGYGLFIDREGNYVNKKMSECTGQEILTELLGQLGFEDADDEIRKTTRVTTVMMPYITSQFERRVPEDRPLVVPKGAKNFAFLGQYVEIPEDVVFTVEYSVRGAMHAVYELMGVDLPIPAIYHALEHPSVAFKALHTIRTGQADWDAR